VAAAVEELGGDNAVKMAAARQGKTAERIGFAR
jgi:hypothetical protein